MLTFGMISDEAVSETMGYRVAGGLKSTRIVYETDPGMGEMESGFHANTSVDGSGDPHEKQGRNSLEVVTRPNGTLEAQTCKVSIPWTLKTVEGFGSRLGRNGSRAPTIEWGWFSGWGGLWLSCRRHCRGYLCPLQILAVRTGTVNKEPCRPAPTREPPLGINDIQQSCRILTKEAKIRCKHPRKPVALVGDGKPTC
jgi:hypothetical protein